MPRPVRPGGSPRERRERMRPEDGPMRGVRTLIVAVSLLVATTGRAWADEKASLENVLLMEQLADVATTQQLLHAASCGPKVPVRSEFLGVIGTIRHCATGSETDPLARPFVSTPLLN